MTETLRDAGPEELPAAVLDRLADLVDAALPAMRPADVPAELRPLLRFTPAKRRRLGSRQMVAAVRTQPRFRAAVVEQLRGSTVHQLDTASADRVAAAASSLLLGEPVAAELVAEAGEIDELRALRAEVAVLRGRLLKAERTHERLAAELAQAREATAAAPAPALEEEVTRLRARLRQQGQRLREALDAAAVASTTQQGRAQDVAAELEQVRADWARDQARLAAEQARAERAERERDQARLAAGEARNADDVRLRLLLDTLTGVGKGLRSELGIYPQTTARGVLPADQVAAALARPRTPGRVLPDERALDRALRLPEVHLLVDGYNVSKTGYPQLTLIAQRDRLVRSLALLAAQTRAEVTVVFDGAAVVSGGGHVWARGVRVVFSADGVIADDVIRELTAAEPEGRPVVVASSDREVAESVRAMGAHSVASDVLLERLAR
ncbi:NYN domain-containing protein [Rhodococcus sp. X156]|uniref:NYN domain-containing protein n=1 Tax=Rhodococcus sp. X156 TaxID=2499145 RepID=UPI0019D2682C|nr:NYN domain-containing protein [Rhodococcus sp. X156]